MLPEKQPRTRSQSGNRGFDTLQAGAGDLVRMLEALGREHDRLTIESVVSRISRVSRVSGGAGGSLPGL